LIQALALCNSNPISPKMQIMQDSCVNFGHPFEAVPFVTSASLFEHVFQVPQYSHPVESPLLGLPTLPHKMSHSLAGLRTPSCHEIPDTRLAARDASLSRVPSSFSPQCKKHREDIPCGMFADVFTHHTQEPPKRTKKSKAHRLKAQIRPVKSERVLCKSLAHRVFLSQQARSFKDMGEAEKMLALSLYGSRADPRSYEYAISVLHALFAEMGSFTQYVLCVALGKLSARLTIMFYVFLLVRTAFFLPIGRPWGIRLKNMLPPRCADKTRRTSCSSKPDRSYLGEACLHGARYQTLPESSGSDA